MCRLLPSQNKGLDEEPGDGIGGRGGRGRPGHPLAYSHYDVIALLSAPMTEPEMRERNSEGDRSLYGNAGEQRGFLGAEALVSLELSDWKAASKYVLYNTIILW